MESATAKEIILNVYHLVDDPEEVNRKQAWQALQDTNILDTGYEHFRRTFASAIDGDITQNEINNAVEDHIQSAIDPVLRQEGVIGDIPESAAEEIQQREETSETSASRARNTGVSVQDLQDVRDRVHLLREQAEFEAEQGQTTRGDRKAEFMAQKVEEWLDELIENSQS